MSYPYEFPVITLDDPGYIGRHLFKIEMSLENKTTRALSFASPNVVAVNPFIRIPNMEWVQDLEAGMLGASGVELAATNEIFDGSQGMRELLRAYDPYVYAWHFRIWYKTDGAVGYTLLFWGFCDMTEPKTKALIWEDHTSWMVTIPLRDTIALLEDPINCPASALVAKLPHAAHDYSGYKIYAYDHNALPTDTKTTQDAGTVQEIQFLKAYDGGANPWVRMPDDDQRPQFLTFFKFTDILQAFSELLGLGTTINSGSPITHSWRFYYKDSVGTIAYVDINGLYLVSSFYASSTYNQQFTFFDPDGNGTTSFYKCNTALDVLKMLATPLGLSARVTYNGSSQRVLAFEELLDLRSSAITISEADILLGATEETTEQIGMGMKVATAYGNTYVEGADNDATKSMNNPFTSASELALWWHGEINDKIPVIEVRDFLIVYMSFWIGAGTQTPKASPARTRIQAMYSPHRIEIHHGSDEANIYYGRTHNYNRSIIAAACAKTYFTQLSTVATSIGLMRVHGYDTKLEVAGIDAIGDNSKRAGCVLNVGAVAYPIKKQGFDTEAMKTIYELVKFDV